MELLLGVGEVTRVGGRSMSNVREVCEHCCQYRLGRWEEQAVSARQKECLGRLHPARADMVKQCSVMTAAQAHVLD